MLSNHLLLLLMVLLNFTFEAHPLSVDVLTDNLFDNLYGDPYLSVSTEELSDDKKAFIDTQVENYLNLITRKSEKIRENSKSKRSLPITIPDSINRDTEGTYVLEGIDPMIDIPVQFSKDIQLFQQAGNWFAIILECADFKGPANNLTILKYLNGSFVAFSQTHIQNGTKFAVKTASNTTLIALIGNNSSSVTIYSFNSEDKVRNLQVLNTANATDISIWSVDDDVYLGIINYNTSSVQHQNLVYGLSIYKWLGYHFDFVQNINSRASKISTFAIGCNHFIALVNSAKPSGSSRVYSEIHKFDLNTDRYAPHQMISTQNCEDIKHFKFAFNRMEQSFLIVANAQKDLDDANIEMPSIVYKYVEDYFIPFQRFDLIMIEEWLPIQGPNHEFVLLGRTKYDGIKSYHYNGWLFVETITPDSSVISGNSFHKINSVHYYILQNMPILVMSSERNNDNFGNMLRLTFVHQNALEKYHNDLFNWCESNLQNLAQEENLVDHNIARRESRSDDEGIQSSAFHTPDNSSTVHTFDQNHMIKLIADIESFDVLLQDVERKALKSLQFNGTHIIEHNIEADTIEANNLKTKSLETSEINGINIDALLRNVININDDVIIDDSMKFEHVLIDCPISPTKINGHSVQNMVHLHDSLELNQLRIDGEVSLQNGLNVNGTLNNVTFDNDHILSNTRDQEFDEFQVLDLEITNLNVGFINGVPLADLKTGQLDVIRIENTTTLKARNIVIGGFINDVDIQTINKHALRTTGDQELTDLYLFDELTADNMDVKTLSNKNVLADFVLTSKGHYHIRQDVQFTENVKVNNLIATEFLDTIPVHKGKLDVLLKDTPELQRITAFKQIEKLELLNPINLHGKIQNAEFDRINPVKTIDEPFVLLGDFVIAANTTVRKILKTNDIRTEDGLHSINKVHDKGLKLTEPEVMVHLAFQQQLNVDEIFIDKVNDINPQTWVVTGGNEQQFIHGSKIFTNDVMITGPTTVLKVNNIDIADLENTVLRKTGNQTISGIHTINNLIARRVSANSSKLGEHSWDSVLTINSEQVIAGTTILTGNLKANSSITNTLQVEGFVNNFNFTQMVDDTVSNTGPLKPISGHKTFTNMSVKNLKMKLDGLFGNGSINYKGDVEMMNAKIENIYFTETCNGIVNEEFGIQDFDKNGAQMIYEEQSFDKVIIHGKLFIESGNVNHVNVKDFEENTVKIDEDFKFGTANFASPVVSEAPVILHGNIIGVDLDNLVCSYSNEEQIVLDEKVFKNDVIVHGSLTMNGSVNEFNYNDLCDFASVNPSVHKKMIIEGNALFTKGPKVSTINNKTVDDIWERAWINDKETILQGSVELEDVLLRNNVSVKGLVDEVSLKELYEDYFSISKSQSINVTFTFSDKVTFESDVATPEVNLTGNVNGINIEEFLQTVLLDDVDQVFENKVYLEECSVNVLEGEYTVNGLSLEDDIMRYDKINIITGSKVIKTMHVGTANIEKPIKIQNVDILNWIENAVMKDGNANIEAKKTIRGNANFRKGISLQGSLDGRKFNNQTIMLKSIPQNITGTKVFNPKPDDLIYFKSLKMKGLINGVNIADLISNQVYKNENITFKTPLHFKSNLTTKNLVLKQPYHGVNVSDLMNNITQLKTLHLVESYDQLLNMSYQISEYLNDQAYFLHSYKEIQELVSPNYIAKSFRGMQNEDLIAVSRANDSCLIYSYFWDDVNQLFVKTGFNVNIATYPAYLNTMKIRDQQFLYVEYPITDMRGPFIGKLLNMRSKSGNAFQDYVTLNSSGTEFMTSFTLRNESCLLFLYKNKNESDIYCEKPYQLILHQSLDTPGSVKAEVAYIKGVPYIIMIGSNAMGASNVNIWRPNSNNSFELQQIIYIAEPRDIATITNNGVSYLAIVSGQSPGGLGSGQIDLRRYDELTDKYITWQGITLDAPIQVEFSLLPSNELLLYVATESPTESLVIYMCEGIAKFSKKIVISSSRRVFAMKQFLIRNKHFLLIYNRNNIRLLQAYFKGNQK